jgi:hypothetical protein
VVDSMEPFGVGLRAHDEHGVVGEWDALDVSWCPSSYGSNCCPWVRSCVCVH